MVNRVLGLRGVALMSAVEGKWKSRARSAASLSLFESGLRLIFRPASPTVQVSRGKVFTQVGSIVADQICCIARANPQYFAQQLTLTTGVA
jgi:hypothetical protein